MFADEKRIKDEGLYTEKPTITDGVYFDGSNAEISNEETLDGRENAEREN